MFRDRFVQLKTKFQHIHCFCLKQKKLIKTMQFHSYAILFHAWSKILSEIDLHIWTKRYVLNALSGWTPPHRAPVSFQSRDLGLNLWLQEELFLLTLVRFRGFCVRRMTMIGWGRRWKNKEKEILMRMTMKICSKWTTEKIFNWTNILLSYGTNIQTNTWSWK